MPAASLQAYIRTMRSSIAGGAHPGSLALRRWLIAALVAVGLLLASRSIASAHATLLRASPSPGSVALTPPDAVRLLFDEPLDLSVSRLAVINERGNKVQAEVTLDPHDVHALVARLPVLSDGEYRVEWSTVSADGHAVSGSYLFRVGRGAATAASAPPPPPLAPVSSAGELAPAILLRAAGDLLVAITAGLLFFRVLFRARSPGVPARRARGLAHGAAAVAPFVLAAHDIVWAAASAPAGVQYGAWLRAMLSTGQGNLELIRLALSALVAWALFLMRRELVALGISVLLVGATGAVGHALVMSPGVAVPLKAAHAFAMAAWIGGLCWIACREGEAGPALAVEARTISSIALIAVLVLAASGVGMAATFLPLTRAAILHSRYAMLLALKVLGLLVLAGLGWASRSRVSEMEKTSRSAADLRRSVRAELIVMLVVFAVGACLSYTSPHIR